MKYRVVILLPVILSMLMLQGCVVAAVGAGIGAVSAGVGAVKSANARKAEAKMKCNEAYNSYLSLMLKNNKDPMSLDEYCKGNA